jgi:hypothetical protein
MGGAEREGRMEGEIGTTKGTKFTNGGLWMCGGEGLKGFA